VLGCEGCGPIPPCFVGRSVHRISRSHARRRFTAVLRQLYLCTTVSIANERNQTRALIRVKMNLQIEFILFRKERRSATYCHISSLSHLKRVIGFLHIA